MERSIRVAVLALLAVVSLGLAGGVEGSGPTEVFRHRQGGYEMALSVLPYPPKVGHVHLSVTLRDVAQASDVTDAEVTIVANDEAGEPTYQVRALNTPQEPLFYVGNIIFKAAGSWTMEVRVDSPELGPMSFEAPLEVEVQSIEASRGGALLFAGVLAVLVGGAAYVWYSAKRRQQLRRDT